MVNVQRCNWLELLSHADSARLFCFGAGKVFRQFISQFPNLKIAGILDNFKKNKQDVIVNNNPVDVMTLSEFRYSHKTSDIIIITCQSYEDIIYQLDNMRELDGLKVYLSQLIMSDAMARKRAEKFLSFRIKNLSSNLDNDFSLKNQSSSIKRFQIWNCLDESATAGSKAPDDIRVIAGTVGYQVINVHPSGEGWRQQQNQSDWEYCYETVTDNSILLLQHPNWQPPDEMKSVIHRLKRDKSIRTISIIHDVEELRGKYNNHYMRQLFDFILECTDVFIVHNEVMRKFFINKGVESNRIVALEIFDYLSDSEIMLHEFENSIVIAGNLSHDKSPYIKDLSFIKDMNFHLFGSNFTDNDMEEKITYHGAFPSDEIVSKLCGGFGLVWDGDSIDTCSGETGNYLRYNSPHKLSLYLAAGMPVIIWEEAAAAEFVREHGAGITVSSLRELPKILNDVTKERYEEYLKNIAPLSEKLRSGAYTKRAISAAEEILRG